MIDQSQETFMSKPTPILTSKSCRGTRLGEPINEVLIYKPTPIDEVLIYKPTPIDEVLIYKPTPTF